ncbi:MAG: DNA-directed RNA polymerase subunit omega [Gemmatimonadetes bacterium]|nr:DNA-directed RNA polymerase subunit omega [Gemmatimonadota bacterium]NNK49160.1 DNA-directed RNA polymerase subunit omega [Gemmatimonadota bacterium]
MQNRVYTPEDLVPAASDKYLGVLVSAKYARELNALPLERSPYGANKLTTMALAAISSGQLEYRLVRKRSAPAE